MSVAGSLKKVSCRLGLWQILSCPLTSTTILASQEPLDREPPSHATRYPPPIASLPTRQQADCYKRSQRCNRSPCHRYCVQTRTDHLALLLCVPFSFSQVAEVACQLPLEHVRHLEVATEGCGQGNLACAICVIFSTLPCCCSRNRILWQRRFLSLYSQTCSRSTRHIEGVAATYHACQRPLSHALS